MIATVTFTSVVLWIHIAGVVIAFGGVFAYPLWFTLLRRAEPAQRAFFHHAQAQLGKYVISPGMLVILVAGIYLASKLEVWSESWVGIPLAILIVLGGLGGAYFAPREQKLAELAVDGRDGEYEALFAQVRTVTLLAAALVLVAMFFMVVKP
jgi:uncharacterized membrane protein